MCRKDIGISTSRGRVEPSGREKERHCGVRIGEHAHDVSMLMIGVGALGR
jgi:hypothetical protein